MTTKRRYRKTASFFGVLFIPTRILGDIWEYLQGAYDSNVDAYYRGVAQAERKQAVKAERSEAPVHKPIPLIPMSDPDLEALLDEEEWIQAGKVEPLERFLQRRRHLSLFWTKALHCPSCGYFGQAHRPTVKDFCDDHHGEFALIMVDADNTIREAYGLPN